MSPPEFHIPNEPTFFLINIPCVGSSMVFYLVRIFSCILRMIRMSSDHGLSSAFVSHLGSLLCEHPVPSVELYCPFLEAGRILNWCEHVIPSLQPQSEYMHGIFIFFGSHSGHHPVTERSPLNCGWCAGS